MEKIEKAREKHGSQIGPSTMDGFKHPRRWSPPAQSAYGTSQAVQSFGCLYLANVAVPVDVSQNNRTRVAFSVMFQTELLKAATVKGMFSVWFDI